MWLILILAATEAETSARVAIANLVNAKGAITASDQGRLAAQALSEEPTGVKPFVQLLSAFSAIPDETRAEFIAQGLTETAPDFVKETCGDTIDKLSKLKAEAVAKKCQLKKLKALPSQSIKTLHPTSLLLAAALIDHLRKNNGSEYEMQVALWVAHFGRSDTHTKGFAKP